jgi:peptidoglycan/LPS O-acetylase OafA/YrhL
MDDRLGISRADARTHTTGPGEIIALTSIRGIAAIWVVVFHLVSNLQHHGWLGQSSRLMSNIIAGGSGFAVDVFFILSGYILVTNYGGKSDSAEFFVHRIARIFPLHVSVLTLMVLGAAAAATFGITPESESFFSWYDLPYHYALIFVWFGMGGWNGPAWSLCVELVAYVTFPAIQRVGRQCPVGWTFVLCGIMLACDVSLSSTVGFPATGFGAIARGLFGFAGGAMLRLANKERSMPNAIMPASVLAIGLIAGTGTYQLGVIPAAALIAALGSSREGLVTRFMSSRPAYLLGLVSFSIYLIHDPLLIVGMQIVRRLPWLQTSYGSVAFVFVYGLILLVCSAVSWKFIELPARHVIRNLRNLRAPHLGPASVAVR